VVWYAVYRAVFCGDIIWKCILVGDPGTVSVCLFCPVESGKVIKIHNGMDSVDSNLNLLSTDSKYMIDGTEGMDYN
jgi:hypothetical protein